MILLPFMLVAAAKQAGMTVPPQLEAKPKRPEDEEWDAAQYPHWTVFCNLQCGAPMPTPGAHWDNAKVVAAVPANKIRTIKYGELVRRGFKVGYSK